MLRLKSKLIIAAMVVLGITTFISCEKSEVDNTLDRKENVFFKNVEIIPNIGEVHNIEVKNFLTKYKNEIQSNISLQEKISLIEDYCITRGASNIRVYLKPYEKFITTNKNGEEGFDFDPIKFTENNRQNISDYFFNKIHTFLIEVKNVSNDKDEIKNIINRYKAEVLEDDNYQINENEQFYNMLLIYENSVDLWYDSSTYLSDNGKAPDEDDYWKIATSDFVGGLLGGLAGGPAAPVTAAIGVVGASAQMAIGLW
jgi:hypothetical protein